VDASRKVTQEAQESLRFARKRFEVGAATQLDVLQSQVDLTQARTNDLVARHGYLAALARLHTAIGVWSDEAGGQ
jgi:outer membrane protein TolC